MQNKPTSVRSKTSRPGNVIAEPIEDEETRGSFFDFLRFGESYTSLILGIIIVVIATVLLLSFVRNKNMSTRMAAAPKQVAVKAEYSAKQLKTQNVLKIEHKNITSEIKKPASKPAVKIAKETTKITTPTTGGTYTVAKGDSLWTIAEGKYKSGYNWVDIAKANNLSNPGMLYTGMKLSLPKVASKIATVSTTSPTTVTTEKTSPLAQTAMDSSKITGNDYTIVKGDTLWSISVRAYADGYQWVKLAKANNLTNPSLIHSGNKLTIPRG